MVQFLPTSAYILTMITCWTIQLLFLNLPISYTLSVQCTPVVVTQNAHPFHTPLLIAPLVNGGDSLTPSFTLLRPRRDIRR